MTSHCGSDNDVNDYERGWADRQAEVDSLRESLRSVLSTALTHASEYRSLWNRASTVDVRDVQREWASLAKDIEAALDESKERLLSV